MFNIFDLTYRRNKAWYIRRGFLDVGLCPLALLGLQSLIDLHLFITHFS